MAQPTNLFDLYDAKGIRESVVDMISVISPAETPLLDMCQVGSSSQKTFGWQLDVLPAPDGVGQIEGNDGTLLNPTATLFRQNYTQINERTFGVSGSEEEAAKYGRGGDMAYFTAKYALDLKRNVEFAVIGVVPQLPVVGSAATARRTAALDQWLTTARSFGTVTGAAPAIDANGFVGTASIDGTLRPLATALLNTVVSACWDGGGKPRFLVCGASQKANFAALDAFGARRTDAMQKTSVATVDFYWSLFGDMEVVPTRQMRKTGVVDRQMYGIDPEYVTVNYFRPWQQIDLAVTGDHNRRELLVEWGLQVDNEAAHWGIFDLQ